MRKLVRALLTALAVLVLTAGMGLWGPATAQAHSSCAAQWGSLFKGGPAATTAEIFDVRAGRHACYDRLVVDVAGNVAGAYGVSYVRAVAGRSAGEVLPLRGGAFLQVLVRAPVIPTDSLFVGPDDLVDVRGYRTFRQVGLVGSSEGFTNFGVGVRARLPFRVFTLPGPGTGSRLVIDVAHRW